jgi:hypothetical protein
VEFKQALVRKFVLSSLSIRQFAKQEGLPVKEISGHPGKISGHPAYIKRFPDTQERFPVTQHT